MCVVGAVWLGIPVLIWQVLQCGTHNLFDLALHASQSVCGVLPELRGARHGLHITNLMDVYAGPKAHLSCCVTCTVCYILLQPS